jgi:hypothetical protein
MEVVKTQIIDFWDCARCGEIVAVGDEHAEIGCDV